MELSEAIKCISCLCTFSRAIVDTDGSLISQNLYTQLERTGYLMGIFNSHERAGLYYGLYHGVIREVINLIFPKYHISIHTRALKNDIEFLYKGQSKVCQEIIKALNNKGVKAKSSESLEFEMGINRMIELAKCNDMMLTSFRVNVNEELAIDPNQRKELVTILNSVIKRTMIQ